MKHHIRLRAGDVSSTQGDGYVVLEFEDAISGVQFLHIEMPYHAFGKFVKSAGSVKVTGDFRGLDHLGKRRVTEKRSVLCPLDYCSKREPLEDWLKANCQEEGWLVSSYLGSRDSVFPNKDGDKKGCWLHYSVTKFVDTTEEERIALLKQPW